MTASLFQSALPPLLRNAARGLSISARFCLPRRGSRSDLLAEHSHMTDSVDWEATEDQQQRKADTMMQQFKQMSAEDLLQNAQSNEPPADPDFYSDMKKPEKKRQQSSHAFRPPVNAEETSIMLFPGQGAQFVGMGKELLDYPNVEDMFAIASDRLGYDLLDLCVNGPLPELSKTVHQQPAIYVTSLAAIEKLRATNSPAIAHCVSAAGFSIGEYAALVFSGAMTFEDGLELVRVRAEAMQRASEECPSGLMTAILGPESKLGLAMRTAQEYCSQRLDMEKPVCRVANFLYPEVKVIGGHSEALEFLKVNGRDFGIKRLKPLPVSGAFHTPLMSSAIPSVKQQLEKTEIRHPIIPVHSNVTSHRYKNALDIRKLLAKQMCQPVQWEQTMHVLFSRKSGSSFPCTFEVGPGKQLGTLLRMTCKPAYNNYQSVAV